MQKYEILLLLNPKVVETIDNSIRNELEIINGFNDVNKVYYGLITKAGYKDKSFNIVNEPVAVPLAYEIKKQAKGIYVLYTFTTDDQKAIAELRRILFLNKDVLRHMIINLENVYGANALANPKKAKTSLIIKKKYEVKRDEFLKSKSTSAIEEQLLPSATFDNSVFNEDENVIVENEGEVSTTKRTRRGKKAVGSDE